MFSANSSQVSGDKLFVEDVFSTYLYTGNDSTLEINNGIDLAGKGGLVWIKTRSLAKPNRLWDTARGLNSLSSNTTGAQIANLTDRDLTSFNSNGFSLGMDYYDANPPSPMASWTFRKAPKFFDVVTYTGDGNASRQLSHALGVKPGFIALKRTDSASNWVVWARISDTAVAFSEDSTSIPFGFNSTNVAEAFSQTNPYYVNAANDTTFNPNIVGNGGGFNVSGATYVAYLFAHDTTSDGIIQCGSYTGNGSSTGPSINLGWEPQWLLIKSTTSAGRDWIVMDNMRGMPVGSAEAILATNTSVGESTAEYLSPTATGLNLTTTAGAVNGNGQTYIYIAIRRGPMRTPTSGTSVFAPISRAGTAATATVTGVGFPLDLGFSKARNLGNNWSLVDRFRGPNRTLNSIATDAEITYSANNGPTSFNMDGVTLGSDATYSEWNTSGRTYINYFFRRAPSFFDEVCYTGTGSAGTITHNLGVAPELVITKGRGSVTNWGVYHASLGATKALLLNSTSAEITSANYWNNTAPTATQVSLGTTTNSSTTFVAYLFASCPGVSKVGSYTGNGSSQTINCGFAAGARFVMIKRTDSTGDWYVFDTARGIVAGNEKYLMINSTAAEADTGDDIDTDSSGFIVNQNATKLNINATGATYIYLAIA